MGRKGCVEHVAAPRREHKIKWFLDGRGGSHESGVEEGVEMHGREGGPVGNAHSTNQIQFAEQGVFDLHSTSLWRQLINKAEQPNPGKTFCKVGQVLQHARVVLIVGNPRSHNDEARSDGVGPLRISNPKLQLRDDLSQPGSCSTSPPKVVGEKAKNVSEGKQQLREYHIGELIGSAFLRGPLERMAFHVMALVQVNMVVEWLGTWLCVGKEQRPLRFCERGVDVQRDDALASSLRVVVSREDVSQGVTLALLADEEEERRILCSSVSHVAHKTFQPTVTEQEPLLAVTIQL